MTKPAILTIKHESGAFKGASSSFTSRESAVKSMMLLGLTRAAARAHAATAVDGTPGRFVSDTGTDYVIASPAYFENENANANAEQASTISELVAEGPHDEPDATATATAREEAFAEHDVSVVSIGHEDAEQESDAGPKNVRSRVVPSSLLSALLARAA